MGIVTTWAAAIVGTLALSAINLDAGTGGGSLVHASLFGTNGDDQITGMVKLSSGKIALCGYTDRELTEMPTDGWAPYTLGGVDAFVLIVNESMDTVLHFTYLGAEHADRAMGIAEDPTGGIIIVGETTSTNFPTSNGVFGQVFSGGIDGFITRLTTDLTSLTRSTFIPGAKDESVRGVAVDSYGNVVVCGSTTSNTGFPTTNGIFREHKGNTDAFVLKASAGTLSLAFSSYFGGTAQDEFVAVDIDKDGRIGVVGTTNGADFPFYPPVPNPWGWPPTGEEGAPYDPSYNSGTSDAVYAIITADGSKMSSCSFLGGTGTDKGTAIAFSAGGNVCVFGSTTSKDFPVPQAGQASNGGGVDAFMTQFDKKGLVLAGGTYFGGTGDDQIMAVREESTEQFSIVGTTTSRNISALGTGTSSKVSGPNDVFVARLKISGYSYYSTVGWPGTELPVGIALDSRGNVLIAGVTTSNSVAWDHGTITNNGSATNDGFLMKWSHGTVNLETPRPTDRLCAEGNLTISWTGSPELVPKEPFTLQYTADGETWTTIVSNITQRSYSWKVPATIPDNITIRVLSAHNHDSRTDGSLTVSRKPEITTQPTAVTSTCTGQTIVLSVDTPDEGAKYQWRKGGSTLANQTSHELTISVQSATDAGVYDCVLTNQCGSTTSAPAEIAVVAGPGITSQPANLTKNENESAVFTIGTAGYNPTFQWQHNEGDIPNANEKTFSIPVLSESDEGAYRCIVTNACGKDTSTSALLVVNPVTAVEDEHVNTLTLAPMPATSSVTVRGALADKPLVIGSVTGIERTIPAGITTFDITSLPPGLYYIQQGKSKVPMVIIH